VVGAIRSALGDAASPLPPGYKVDEQFLHEVRVWAECSPSLLWFFCWADWQLFVLTLLSPALPCAPGV